MRRSIAGVDSNDLMSRKQMQDFRGRLLLGSHGEVDSASIMIVSSCSSEGQEEAELYLGTGGVKKYGKDWRASPIFAPTSLLKRTALRRREGSSRNTPKPRHPKRQEPPGTSQLLISCSKQQVLLPVRIWKRFRASELSFSSQNTETRGQKRSRKPAKGLFEQFFLP